MRKGRDSVEAQTSYSVLTAQEGAGLDLMADGLIKRYQQAVGVAPRLGLKRRS